MCGFYLAGCDQARRGRARSRPDVEHKCRRRDIPSQGHSVAGNGVRARRSPAIMPLSTRKTTMLTLYDYLPSQNAWKVRQLLHHLGLPHRTEHVGIFEGEGRRESFLRISPAGTVPAIELDDGRVLAGSNAILCFLDRTSVASGKSVSVRVGLGVRCILQKQE